MEGTGNNDIPFNTSYTGVEYSISNHSVDANLTRTNHTRIAVDAAQESSLLMDELKLIKAIVLMVVVVVLLLSTCKVLFKTFSQYNVGKRDEHIT